MKETRSSNGNTPIVDRADLMSASEELRKLIRAGQYRRALNFSIRSLFRLILYEFLPARRKIE